MNARPASEGRAGAGTGGASFLTSADQVVGLSAASRGGAGRSGIVYWDNLVGADSPIVGVYPLRDTAIMDSPTWFTSTGPLVVDARFPNAGFFAAGLWLLDAQSASAPGSAVIAHGTNTAGTARVTVYRDERALPRRPGARVAVDRDGCVLERPVGTSEGAGLGFASPPPRAELASAACLSRSTYATWGTSG